MDKESEIYDFYLRTKGGWGFVSGKCMEPIIKNDWKVKVKPAGKTKIETEDIAVFKRNIFLCHRVVGKISLLGRTYFIHKGDNSLYGGVFKENDLVGKVIRVFDEKGLEVKRERWQEFCSNDIKFKAYVYLFFYMVKKIVWKEKKNRFIDFFNRTAWRFMT